MKNLHEALQGKNGAKTKFYLLKYCPKGEPMPSLRPLKELSCQELKDVINEYLEREQKGEMR